MTPTKKVEQLLARRNVRGLGAALRHRNVVIRRRAAQALGELRDPGGVPYLTEALRKDGDEWVQRYTMDALRLINTPDAIDVLTWAMYSSERRLSSQALQTLHGINTPE